MSKDIVEYINSLEDVELGRPISIEEIKAAEEKLGLKFADDYFKLLLNFGYFFGYDVELMSIAKNVGEDVVGSTLMEKTDDDTAPSDMYVIENVGWDGLLVWQHESGAVFYKYRFDEDLEKVADSLAEYIEKMASEYEDDEDEDE